MKAQGAENENLADQLEELQDELKSAKLQVSDLTSKLEDAEGKITGLEESLAEQKKSAEARIEKLEQEHKESVGAANASATAAQQKLQMLQQQQQQWRSGMGSQTGRQLSIDSASTAEMLSHAETASSSASSSSLSLTLPPRGTGSEENLANSATGPGGLTINSTSANSSRGNSVTSYLNSLTSPLQSPSPSTWGFNGGGKSPMMARRSSSKGSMQSVFTNPYEAAAAAAAAASGSGAMGISEIMYEEEDPNMMLETPTSASFAHFEDSASTVGGVREPEGPAPDRSGSGGAAGGPGASIQLVGRMSRTIRVLESELSSVKLELSRAASKEDAATKEVLRLAKDNEELVETRARVAELELKIESMSAREQTALEMLGEKSEQVDELRADVEDLKAMYRTQTEDLIDQLIKAQTK